MFCFVGAAFLFTTLLFATAAPVPTDKLEPDGAPSRLTDGPGVPEPIVWPAPPLAKGPFRLESAEERNLRVVVVARGLEQPWSLAFLPDGTMLITERPGRLRVVRHGVLDPEPVAGLPDIKADGLQGLMDVVLHPQFAENRWLYFTYHKPEGGDAAVTLARGTWNGTAIDDVRDLFESHAAKTEASRLAFAGDGMI